MRSILIAIYELDIEEILIIGHTDCGAMHIDSQNITEEMKSRGVARKVLIMLNILVLILIHGWAVLMIVSQQSKNRQSLYAIIPLFLRI